MNLTGFALRNQPLVLMIVAALAISGVSVTANFPSQEDPPVTVREAVITTYFPGMEPEDVELLITRTIEKALARTTERDNIYSFSWNGKSVVHLEVQDQYEQSDLDLIWKDVRNRVIDITPSLPEGVIGPFVNDDFGDVTVVSVALTGDGFSLAQLHGIAKGVQDELYLLDGVGRVQLYGVQEETIWIEFSTAKMAQLGFSPRAVHDALVSQNLVLPGGTIDTGHREVVV